jgi:cell division protein FtsQ
MKKFKVIAIWTFIIAYLAIALSFVLEKRNALVCKKIEVHVVDSLRNGFIEDKQIIQLLEHKGIKLIGKNFREIDLNKIENLVNEYPLVKDAEVYKTIDGCIAIDIKQRNPIIRVMDSRNVNYYIDDQGYIMRTSGNYTSHVIIANGNIHTTFPITNRTSVLELEKQADGKNKLFADLYRLGNYITNNKFWNAQIQQIYVDTSGDLELIPRIGSHIIIFGDYTDCETKFRNLMSLYKNGLPVVGWNKYETINLKFKGQVVCTKRN